MAYERNAWADGPAGGTNINAARLNHMEKGIEEAHEPLIAAPGLDADLIDSDVRYAVNALAGVLHLPEGSAPSGVLTTTVLIPSGSRPKLQTYLTATFDTELWTRFSGSTGWSTWERLDGRDKLDVGGFLGTAGDLNDATEPGTYGYWSSTLNRPGPLSGTVWVAPVHNSSTRVQLAVEYGSTGGLYSRFSGSTGWSGWKRLDAGAVPDVPSPAPPLSAAGFKTVALALTVGGSPSTQIGNRSVRMPFLFSARVRRWRLHLRNINPRTGAGTAQSADLTGVWFGTSTAVGSPNLTAAPVRVGPAGVVSSGQEYVTPWVSTPLEAGVPYALSYGVDSGTTGTSSVVGGGWISGLRDHASQAAPAVSNAVTSLPLDAWIEAEVAPDVPVVAGFGDSLSSGVGATLPVFDSWLSQYCRRIGALPVHYAASGDTMAGWSDPLHYKWQRWQHLSRPDAVVHAMGSNDVFGGANLAEMKARRAASLQLLADLVSPVIVSATLLPRSGVSGTVESVRRDYNAWLMELPDAGRDVFDFAAAISGNDEDLSSSFDSGDSVHLNTAGYKALSDRAAAGRALVTGRRGWVRLQTDDLTGSIRDAAAPGTFDLTREGSLVTLRVSGVRLAPGTGTGFILPNGLPVGYRAGSLRVAGQLRDDYSTAWTHEVTVATDDVSWVAYSTHTTRTNVRPAVGYLQGEIRWFTDDPLPAP